MGNMMNKNEFKSLIKRLVKEYHLGDTWLDTIPSDINSVFFDNPYVDSLHRTNTLLMQALFDDALLQEVQWFIHEWRADNDVSLRTITFPDGSTCVINDVDDFVDYLVKEGYLT
jgi:hypothetical protein